MRTLNSERDCKAHTVQADQEPPVQATAHPASGFNSIGHELDSTAPLWRVYRDEVRSHDQNVTFDEWNKTLDVLLIFAGLFSAVVTSFLIASYPLLAPGNENEAVINAIHALAMAINSSIALPPPKPAEPVTASVLWVNGLWSTSLFIALAVAFFAILAKQWLVEYNHRMADPPAAVATPLPARSNDTSSSPPMHRSDTPEARSGVPSRSPAHLATLSPTASLAWARRRQFFFAAFAAWHVPVLITQVLPFLLHIALFFFLVGLSLFVSTLNGQIARGVTLLTVLLFSLYWIATILPVFRVDCLTATPLVRRAREAPTWIAIAAVRLWRIILPLVLSAFGPSRVTSLDLDSIMTDLRRRQQRMRDSGWLKGGMSTDEEVKLDTLQWLILVSGSETGTTAALHALGALPPDSEFLPALQTITSAMDSAVARLGNQVSPSPIEIIRAVRSELVLGRASWTLPLLGLDLSSALARTLHESQHPDARLLSAAMHLDGMLSKFSRERKALPFSSLYNITDAALRGDISLDSCQSTIRLLLDCPGITVPAFSCLSVILATRSHHLDASDKKLIFHVYRRLSEADHCYANTESHTCDGLCVVVFMVHGLGRTIFPLEEITQEADELREDDLASLMIVPIILSHLLPRLMPDLKRGNKHLVPLSMSWNRRFADFIASSDWLKTPYPVGNTDVEVLSTLLSRFDWSDSCYRDMHLNILQWFMSRGQYKALQTPSLLAKLQGTLTCTPFERWGMLQHLRLIVHHIKVYDKAYSEDQVYLGEFLEFLISLCKRVLQMEIDENNRRVLLQAIGPELGACVYRMWSSLDGLFSLPSRFLRLVDVAIQSVDDVENKSEYLLHLAQHTVVLDPYWTQHDKVGAHLDVRLMEDVLMRNGPCIKCNEGSASEWPEPFLVTVRRRKPIIAQDPQPGPYALPPPAAAASDPALLSMTASPVDVVSSSSSSSHAATPHTISVSPIKPAAPIAATGLSDESALNVPAVGPATALGFVLVSTPDAAETTTPSPHSPAAQSQARSVDVQTTSTPSPDSESPEDGVDIGTGSSTE
ncbi:hypothetical protein EXIGLDRAFT_834380 [Exidia glandulosa HHB12029]|uniref:DUF6535 domain-containing protein n=1 Tax=Exidia glandulosa HHB12029 TaxID=1314781 RepID=A0A165JTK5_EXIGL|nr:hypothetical protein EXIGLDRAFT_834380 [Exidia glandulosa HHB12029]